MIKNLLRLIFGKRVFRRSTVSTQTEDKILEDWRKIEEFIQSKSPASNRQALIMADKSLDNALKDIVDGETMGDRLKLSKDRFEPTLYNKIWEVHMMRNALVHESGYEPPYHSISNAFEIYKRALLTLGIRKL